MEQDKEKKYSENWAQEDCPKTYGVGIRHLQMACMTVCVTALFICRSCMGVAILAMTDSSRMNGTSITIYNWDKQKQGAILSSFFWGYLVMQIPAGLLSKKFGGKPILFFALTANGILSLFIPTLASMGGWMMVCAARMATGMTQACAFPATHTLLGRWLPSRERTAFSGIVYGGGTVGMTIAMSVSGALAETAFGWSLIFYSMCGLMLATAALWYGVAANCPGDHRLISQKEKEYIDSELVLKTSQVKSNLRVPWLHIFRSVPVWALIAAHLGNNLGFVLFLVDMPTYLEKALGISLKSSASLSALPYISMWVGSILSSNICEKLINRGLVSAGASRKLFNFLSQVGIGGGLIVLSFLSPDNRTTAVATLIIGMFMNGSIMAGFLVNHLDLSPNFAGVLLSLTNFVATIGAIGIPLFSGFILKSDPTDTSRWRIVFLVVAALSTILNVLYVIFGSADRQYWDDPDFDDKTKADPGQVGIGGGLIVLSFLSPDNRTTAVATLIIGMFMNGSIMAGFLVNHLDLSPNFAGVLLSLTNFVATIGAIGIPLFSGFILKSDPTDTSRWRIVFLVVAALSTILNVLYVIFGSADRQYWDDPDFDDKTKADPEEIKPVMKKEKDEENKLSAD